MCQKKELYLKSRIERLQKDNELLKNKKEYDERCRGENTMTVPDRYIKYLEDKNAEYLSVIKDCINGTRIYMRDIDHAVFFRGVEETLLKYGDL